MATTPQLLPGFEDYSRQSNAIFRTCLDALSRPATIYELPAMLQTPHPLCPNAAAVFITLADFETSFWLDATLQSAPDVAHFLRFHTGAKQTDDYATADFALLADPARMPPLADFKTGTPEFPDRSTTVIVQVETLRPEGWTLTGPGVKDTISFSATPLPPDFVEQMTANRATFPCGVDLIFTTPTHLAALPRSVTLATRR